MMAHGIAVTGRAALLCLVAVLIAGCVQNRTIGGSLDDTTADISLKTKLLKDRAYDYGDVDITVFEGRMMLTGTMASEEGLAHVEALAGNAPNVTEIVNEITVGDKTAFMQGARDAVIDRQLATALLADAGVVRANYQFAVSDGVVYMIGVAQGPTELTLATEHARRISGVKKVVSHVIYIGDPKRETRE